MLEEHLKMIEKAHEWHNKRAIESHRDVLRVFREMGKITQEDMDSKLKEIIEKIKKDHSSCPFLLELQKIKKDHLELRVEYAYEVGSGIEEAEKELKEFTDSLVK